jgi:UDP-N-acetylmuramyl tripeptide synthase
MPARLRLALLAGRAASRASRLLRRGRGAVVGGHVTVRVAPDALRLLGAGRPTALVTGTNGKTTTTLMLVEALGGASVVASNTEGANMPAGLVAALARHPDAPLAVLEVDELHVPDVLTQLVADVLVVLNLSRDQLDRTNEVRRVAERLHEAVAAAPQCTVVANCDDVLVTSAVAGAADVVWVSAGAGWTQDSGACPRCGEPVQRSGLEWWCSCGLARPRPDWSVVGGALVDRWGTSRPLRLGVPGAANRANAALAVAAAQRLGVAPGCAVDRVRRVHDVDGRYATVRRGQHDVTLLLAKNPAGWAEALSMVEPDADHVVVAVNGQGPDGRDLSWLWDVRFERLQAWPVTAAGERCADLAVRLTYADLPHEVRADPVRAVESAPPGRVTVLANYTAFTELRHALVGG